VAWAGSLIRSRYLAASSAGVVSGGPPASHVRQAQPGLHRREITDGHRTHRQHAFTPWPQPPPPSEITARTTQRRRGQPPPAPDDQIGAITTTVASPSLPSGSVTSRRRRHEAITFCDRRPSVSSRAAATKVAFAATWKLAHAPDAAKISSVTGSGGWAAIGISRAQQVSASGATQAGRR
jgi:hypothetical protein